MAGSIESLFGILLLVFVLAVAGFMSGNVLQGLGALGALLLIGLVLRFFKSAVSDRGVSREVTMLPCQYCGNLMPQDAKFCPYCGTRKQ